MVTWYQKLGKKIEQKKMNNKQKNIVIKNKIEYMKRIFIVYGHYNDKSFNASIKTFSV